MGLLNKAGLILEMERGQRPQSLTLSMCIPTRGLLKFGIQESHKHRLTQHKLCCAPKSSPQTYYHTTDLFPPRNPS